MYGSQMRIFYRQARQFWVAAVAFGILYRYMSLVLDGPLLVMGKSKTVLSAAYSQPTRPDQTAKVAFAGSVSKSTWVLLTSWA